MSYLLILAGLVLFVDLFVWEPKRNGYGAFWTEKNNGGKRL